MGRITALTSLIKDYAGKYLGASSVLNAGILSMNCSVETVDHGSLYDSMQFGAMSRIMELSTYKIVNLQGSNFLLQPNIARLYS